MRKILFPLAFIFQSVLAQQAEVTNVTAAQRTDGSKLVDITYDITEDTLFTSFYVSVEVSFDGGATYTQTNYVDGDVGVNISSGTSRQITWLLGDEYPDIFFEDVKVKVTATGYIAGELPFEFVTVPAGEYTYGPGDTVLTIDYDYEIMKYEVTDYDYVVYLMQAMEEDLIIVTGAEVRGDFIGDVNNPAENNVQFINFSNKYFNSPHHPNCPSIQSTLPALRRMDDPRNHSRSQCIKLKEACKLVIFSCV